MEKADTRLLEEWKANLDLLKFYETLKQQRFAHFLTIQTAFLAIFALLAKEAIGVFSVVTLAALVLVPIAPLVISFYFMRLVFSSMLIHFGWHLANPSWRPASSSQSLGSGTEIPAGAGALFVKSSMNVSAFLAI